MRVLRLRSVDVYISYITFLRTMFHINGELTVHEPFLKMKVLLLALTVLLSVLHSKALALPSTNHPATTEHKDQESQSWGTEIIAPWRSFQPRFLFQRQYGARDHGQHELQTDDNDAHKRGTHDENRTTKDGVHRVKLHRSW